MTGAASPGPLDGVKVLDLSRVLAGPSAAQTLADLGADVIKIERPGGGDDTRMMGPHLPGPDVELVNRSAYFWSVNRGKRSVVIDLADPDGADLVRGLACHVDVLIENFKVGTLARYRLGYADLAALKAWQRELMRAARHDEHPWNAGLLIESLVSQAAGLWPRQPHTGGRASGGASLNSAR